MANNGRILIIDFSNFEDYPIGGYLSFAKSLMDSFGSDLALAGITTSKIDPIGKWIKKEINSCVYDFFAMARYDKSKTRHLIPDRLVSYLLFKYFQTRILKINLDNIFLQRQEMLLSMTGLDSRNVCYCFAGLENPLSISKYQYASYLSVIFEKKFFIKLQQARTILASGDDNAIRGMILRSKGALDASSVIKFPTRINTDIFRPMDRDDVRTRLNLSKVSTIIVTTGRLAPLKGWKFMIDCFMLFERTVTDCRLYLIGDGEDHDKIQQYISVNELNEKVILPGRKSPEEIAMYLNAADLFIMGSYKEGWSTSLIEAIACRLPACVTDFSSAKEIIDDGINGFVVDGHDIDLFVQSMLKSLKIPRPVPNHKVLKLSSHNLKEDLLKYWKLV